MVKVCFWYCLVCENHVWNIDGFDQRDFYLSFCEVSAIKRMMRTEFLSEESQLVPSRGRRLDREQQRATNRARIGDLTC